MYSPQPVRNVFIEGRKKIAYSKAVRQKHYIEFSHQDVFNLNEDLGCICVHCGHQVGVLPLHLVVRKLWF